MADGTPDFADLLAAFDEAPPVTLHQISSGTSLQLTGGSQLPYNQPYVPGQSHHNQLAPGLAVNESAGLHNRGFIQPGNVIPQGVGGPAVAEEPFGGGSLGSMFLSCVESMLSDEGGSNPLVMQIPPPAAQAKAIPRKPKQQKQPNPPPPNGRTNNPQANRNAQNNNTLPYTNIAPAPGPAQSMIALQNTALNLNFSGIKSNSTSSPPFAMQPGAANITFGGQQKVNPQNQFIHPMQGSRQAPQPTNPPRPLSATSSTSDHLSRPGSVPQPSPSCSSNHSGDPATPLTPQSYNAGTPQPYKPATPQSNLSNQQRQRAVGYSDAHAQQVPSGINSGSENFVSHQRTGMQLQARSSPGRSTNVSNDSLNDLPTPLKEAFVSPSAEPFDLQNNTPNNQTWNAGPAVMAPNALFTSTAQSRLPLQPNLMPSETHLNFGYSDVNMFGAPMQPGHFPHRIETNTGTESLTSKQNELLDQLSSFGKSKSKQTNQRPSLGALDSGLSGSIGSKFPEAGKSDHMLRKQLESNRDTTMDMLNKVGDAGAAAVKELLGSHAAQYEAISPVSDYAMSPSNKPSLHDDLPESIIFSPPKFSSHPELPLGHDLTSAHEDPMTDPVLMYLKHDNDDTANRNVSKVVGNSGSFLNQDLSSNAPFKSESSWLTQTSTHGSKAPNTSQPPYPESTITTKSSQVPGPSNDLTTLWNPSLPLTSDSTTHPSHKAITVTSSDRATAELGTKIPPHSAVNSQVPPYGQKQQTVPSQITKTQEGKPFGLNRRKNSTEKSKLPTKPKKPSSFDAEFGFESDDETEPTIRLSKPTSKTKKSIAAKQTNLVPQKARIANAYAGKDLKNQMEQLQQLQQQKEMLLKQYQEQHKGNSQANAAALGVQQNKFQASVPKPAVSEGFRKRPEAASFNTPLPSKFSTPTSHQQQPRTTHSEATKPRPQEFPTPLPLVQPNASPRFNDVMKSRSHDIQLYSSISTPLEAAHISPSSTLSPFLGYHSTLTDIATSAQGHAPTASTSSLFTIHHQMGAQTVSATSAADNQHRHFYTTQVSSLPSSFGQTPGTLNVPRTVLQPAMSRPLFTSSVSSIPTPTLVTSVDSMRSTTISAPSSRPQPYDGTNFDLEWLNRVPDNATPENNKVPQSIDRTTMTPASATSKPSMTFRASDIPSTVTTPNPRTRLPEDNVPPLKQSIHTVHHLNIPKSQPVTQPTTKDSAPALHETKHLNLKKHRILEGAYPQPTESYKSVSSSHAITNSNGTTAAVAHSVLDKQRRYSKDRRSNKPPHRIQHQVTEVAKTPANVPQPKEAAPTKTAADVKSSPNADPNEKKEKDEEKLRETDKGKKEDKTKDDRAGSMLSLFNSLLQEASESAADSLKTTLGTKQETKNLETEQEISAVPPITSAPKPGKPKITSSQQKSSISTTPSTQPATQNLPVAKKPAKRSRPAATVPFKRRPYPAIDDLVALGTHVEPVSSSSTISRPTSVHSPTSGTLATSHGGNSSTTSTPKSTLPAKIPPVTTKPTQQSVGTLKVESAAVKETATESIAEKSPSKTIGLPKLRITAFRSSKGDIIHQASMVGAAVDSTESDHGAHRKHKKRKKKKKRRISSSDYDSSVSSSLATKSPLEAAVSIAEVEAKRNKQVMKDLDKKVEAILRNVESTTKETANFEAPKASQKRKRTKTACDNIEKKKSAKRIRVSKMSGKKKQDVKDDEPIVRYQPKSALQTSSSAPGAPATDKNSVSVLPGFRRAPGKLPLYLNASEAKSATVPTIQLVARNTKLLESVVENKTTQPAKVVSVKITNSLPSKSYPSQLLPNSGVHYIIPNTRGQQRIILPNISTPVTVPVSIVSPIIARSFSGGFMPVPVCPVTASTPSSSSKSQLLSVPVSSSDTPAGGAKTVSTKQVEQTKSHSTETKESMNLTLSSSHSFNPAIKPSNLLTTQASSSVAVTGALTVPRVTTKVSSSVLPNSKSANAFQSTFSKLISSQNPVGRYSPPLPPVHLKMDLSGRKQFQCLECKDTFIFSESLEDHYERRSILIKVRCMQCNQDLVFLNKCKLLLHARQHSDKGGNGMQFNNAHISPLPLTLCKERSKEFFLKKSTDATSEKRKSSLVSSEEENFAASTPTSYPTVLACTDCNFVASTPEALEEHFQRLAPPVSPDSATTPKPASGYTCDMCSVTVPNQCSFMAHMRMHKRATPHTCPECGQTFDNDGSKEHACSDSRREIDFNLHLSIQCFHLSRMSCYKCRLCSTIFKNADLLRRHLEVRHLQTFYKCRDCPMAFKTQENITSHQRSAHGMVARTKVIHKCPLCDTVFTDNSPTQQLFLLQKHFEGHMNHPSINITAYKCLFCNNIYERKSLLRDHLKSAHDVTASDSGSSSDLSGELNEARLLLGINKGEVASVPEKRPIGNLGTKDSLLSKVPKILSPDGSAVDITNNALIASGFLGMEGKRSSLSSKLASASPAAIKSTKQPLKIRLKGVTHAPSGLPGDGFGLNQNSGFVMRDGRKIYPCGDCGKELPSASARLNHVRLKHKGIRTLYCCPHCPVGKIKFAKKISLKKHLKKEHDIEEVTKQDVRTEYAKMPVGQRFDPTTINPRDDLAGSGAQYEGGSASGERKVRKKVTTLARKRPARQARRVCENSDGEVEQILSNNRAEDAGNGGVPDFSALKFPDVYTCAKCGYESKDRLEFQGHVVEHREDAESEGILNSMQQCTECGLCFASLASRAKHLFIKHKIKKWKLLEKYDKRLMEERAAKGNLPATLGGGPHNAQSGPGSAKRHKCSVCYRRFEDDGQLRTHMRTHGLAFVKSKHLSS